MSHIRYQLQYKMNVKGAVPTAKLEIFIWEKKLSLTQYPSHSTKTLGHINLQKLGQWVF